MHIYFTLLSIVAGTCLGFGILYLFIGLRRKDNKPLNLTFAVFALCYAITLFNGIRWYSTNDVVEYVAINRIDSIFVTGAFISLILYVSFYTNVRPRIFLWGLIAAFIIPALVFLISPKIFTGDVSDLTYITLPWGEKLTNLDSTGSIWLDIVLLAKLVTLGYIVYALVRQFIRGERKPAIILGLGILPFIIGIFYEVLGESGVVPYIPFGEVGFLGIAIAASLQMSNTVIKTEESLEQHQQNLEGLVKTRTLEVSQANEQLKQEINQHEQTEQALNRRVEELAFLHQSSQTLNTVTDLPTELEIIAETITYLFDARSTRIVVPTEDESGLNILAGFVREPVPPETINIFSYPLTEMPLTREILNSGESRVISNIQSLPLPPSISDSIIAFNIHGVMLVPLIIRGFANGLLYISTDQVDRTFTQNEIQLAETIAGDLAVAIENARLFETAKASATAEERSRIARELHDSVTQTMYSVSIMAEALPRILDRDIDEAKRNARYLRQTTLSALAEMRTLLFELRPDTLTKASLHVLLQQQADVLMGRARVPVDVSVNCDAILPDEVKIGFYRMAQEALNNIHKHAQATQAWLTLRQNIDTLTLSIRDNGKGFDPSDILGKGLGLQMMQERANEIGAKILLLSEPGQGTKIAITWPAPIN